MERYESGRSEFLAVYGRRRVGKTFLIRETLSDKITFQHTSLNSYDEENPVSTGDQLRYFYNHLLEYGLEDVSMPKDWIEAFSLLKRLLQHLDDGTRQVVFLDELPWLDTDGSRFIIALEAFWNDWADGRNIMLVVCGSAASWMIKYLVNNTGGLYGRLTWDIKLSPFSLYEAEQMLASQGVSLSRYDQAQLYMAVGGMPYYLGYVQRGMSLAQNVDALFFRRNAKLRLEFDRLFRSQYKNYQCFEGIVRFLSTKHCGYTRSEIAAAVGQSDGGVFSKKLKALEECDFIQSYRPYDAEKYETLYRLIDPFCWFYLRFVESKNASDSFWQENEHSALIRTWRGLAFEELCMLHITQIKQALGIVGIASRDSALTLRHDENHDGAQMDLIIDRSDNVVNLCEMKFYSDDVKIDKEEDRKLRHRMAMMMETLGRKQSLQAVLVTSFGLCQGIYSGTFVRTITLEDLFAK